MILGTDLLTNLALQIRMDLRYLKGHNMPAVQATIYHEMRTGMLAKRI